MVYAWVDPAGQNISGDMPKVVMFRPHLESHYLTFPTDGCQILSTSKVDEEHVRDFLGCGAVDAMQWMHANIRLQILILASTGFDYTSI